MIPVYLYQWFISPLKGPSCRHIPTCSTYSIQALRKHGPWHGLMLGTNRILRCRTGRNSWVRPGSGYINTKIQGYGFRYRKTKKL
ncbi:MAG: membrane protein insertion efficiency factor YidD [Marinilabiliales bacterium]|nr:membrane protein insertion efficiency factor YidD [Marinilabiliales bacterium]